MRGRLISHGKHGNKFLLRKSSYGLNQYKTKNLVDDNHCL